MGLGGLIPKTDKPNTDLLPRFAAASQWLAEEHPDAPRVYEWCDLEHARVEGQGFAPNEGGECCEVDDADVINPDACLAGAMEWAIKVYGWAWHNEHILGELSLHHSRHGVESWTLALLESICTALGREG